MHYCSHITSKPYYTIVLTS